MIGMWQDYNADDLETLTLGGLLHDIGKSKIPPEIINKPGRLTPEEYELVKKHSEYGYELLKIRMYLSVSKNCSHPSRTL